MKKQFVKDLDKGDKVDSVFAVKFKKPLKPYVKGYMFELRIADKSDEITAKYWGEDKSFVEELYKSFEKSDVLHLTGTVNEYRGRLEIGISKANGDKLERTSEYEMKDFVDVVGRNVEEMLSELTNFVHSLQNTYLQSLVERIFRDEEFVNRFKHAPASMMYHQNKIGGLLEHTVNVTKICELLHNLYPGLDRDLLLTGSILHDVGKIFELEVTTIIDVTEEGMLRGHTVIGEDYVRDKIKAVRGFPERLKLKLLHMILAHHGEYKYGAARAPQLPEAIALHYADYCDAKVDLYCKRKKEAKTDNLWVWDKKLGHIYLK